MNDEILNRIRGRRISRFTFVKYPGSELDQVILHLESGPAFEFGSKEFVFGRYEAYTLQASEYHGNDGIERLDAGWTVGMIEVVERQDWLEPADANVKTIGNNPTTHTWGAIGTAPAHASHTTIVTSSITFVSDKRDRRAMVYLADYPGFVSFTTDAREITSVRRAHGGA
jgi:hypothetical protein